MDKPAPHSLSLPTKLHFEMYSRVTDEDGTKKPPLPNHYRKPHHHDHTGSKSATVHESTKQPTSPRTTKTSPIPFDASRTPPAKSHRPRHLLLTKPTPTLMPRTTHKVPGSPNASRLVRNDARVRSTSSQNPTVRSHSMRAVKHHS